MRVVVQPFSNVLQSCERLGCKWRVANAGSRLHRFLQPRAAGSGRCLDATATLVGLTVCQIMFLVHIVSRMVSNLNQKACRVSMISVMPVSSTLLQTNRLRNDQVLSDVP